MLSKVKNILNIKKWARPAPRPQANDQTLPVTSAPILPEIERLTLTVEQNEQTLTESCLPVLERRTARTLDQNIPRPCFPPELERLIFEHAARQNRRAIPSLMRVASRVKEWVTVILYETIIFNRYPYNPPSQVLTIHGNSVQHLFLRDAMSIVAAWNYLHSCPNLCILSFFADELARSPQAPRGSSWSSFRFQCPTIFPVYQHLTHLELMTACSPLLRIDWLVSLPSLTHLFILSPMTNINGAVKQIFKSCLMVRIMLWCPWKGRFSDIGEPTKQQIQAIKLKELEPRLVICKVSYEQYVKQFIAHVEGKSGSEIVWRVAEEIVNKRLKTGTTDYADIVNVSRFTIPL